MSSMGMVYLVGAGPGDAGLLTLRGAELLGRADVVVYDRAVHPELLSLAAKSAELIDGGNPSKEPATLPSELHQLGAWTRAGKLVVRLKGGNTCVAVKGMTEAEQLANAGIPFEVVPGVSSADGVPGHEGAAASGGIPKAGKTPARQTWLQSHPLFGRRVVVTRAREQAGHFSRQLRDLGAEVLEVPTIKIEPPTRREDLVDALLTLNSYDWLVFTSANGVSAFFDYFFRQFHDMRDLGGARIAAIGPATAQKLKDLHLQVDLMPDEALGTCVAEAFGGYESIENLKICLLRAEVANRELAAALEELGAIVDDIAVYRTVPETEDPSGAGARLSQSGADWITFTSASTVQHFHARFDLPAMRKRFPGMRLASIGPETSKALAVLGLRPTVEAAQHTIDGLLQALVAAGKSS